MKMRILFVTLASLLILSSISCIRVPDKEYGGNGDILSVGAHKPKLVDRVVYVVNGQNYVISSDNQNKTIAVVKTRIVNLKSTQVKFSVDENSVTLNTSEGEIFNAFDPELKAEKTSEEVPENNPYGLQIWGEFTLKKGYEIAGVLFFEVPWGLDFSDLIWDDVEYVRVPYPK